MQRTLRKVFNLSNVSYRFILNNRKATLTTLVGLVISLTIITSSIFLVESYRSELIDEILLLDRNDYSGEIQFDLYPDALKRNETGWIRNTNFYEQIITNTFEVLNYKKYLDKQSWYCRFDIGYWNGSGGFDPFSNFDFIDLYTLESFSLFEKYLDFGGRFPQNYSEIVVVTKTNSTKLEIGQQLEISIPPGQAGPARYGSLNITIVGVIEFEKIQYLLKDYILTQAYSKDFLMLTFTPYGIELIELMKRQTDLVFVSHVIGKIYLNTYKIDIYDLNREKTKFNTLLTELDNRFSTLDNYFELIDVYQLQTGLGKSETRMQILKILLLLIDLPVIAVSLYLVSYSFNLIKRRKIETIGTIKTRGASKEQIFIFLTNEVIISTIFALLCGLLLGFFLTEILLKSINFLDFSGEKIPVIIQPSIKLNLIVISFAVIFVLNLSSIARYSKMTIFESTKPVENKEPFWKQYYLDFMSTAIGLVGYYIINEIGKSTLNWEESPLLPLIFLLLGVPAPFLLFAGSILVIARIFPLIIDKLAKFLWKKTGLIFAFALMNIFRHKQTATRTVILITLALSYVIISASLAFSIDESKRFETNYNTGADIKLNAPYLNVSTLNRLYNNISEINTISQVVFGFIPSAHGIHYYIFCFVDTKSFAETAFFDEKIFGLSEPLTTLMTKLSDNKSILLYKPNFEGRPKLKINDTFTFSLPNRTEETRLNYTIVGSFNLWPQSTQYYRQSTDLSRYTYFVIGSLGMYDDLIEPELISLSSIHYIIDLEEGDDVELISEKIWLLTGFQAQSAELLYLNYEKSVDRRFGLSLLNSALLSCVVISVVGVFTFTFFTYLERDKERGIERALGMTRLQTGILFSIEGLVILLFGIIIGLCTGLINTTFFLFVAQLGRSVPPIIVAYPFDFISTFILIIAIIACINTLIIAHQSTRRDISRVLKVE